MPAESFLDVARALLEDGDAKAAFADDPDAFLADRGLEGLSADDLADATGFVSEALPPHVAAQLGHPDTWTDDPLGRIAELEPISIEDLEADDDGDDGLGLDADPGPAADTGAASFAPVGESLPDPGFGVGYSLDDLDDLSAPETHDGELPVGFDLSLDEAGMFESADHDLVDPGAHALAEHDLAAHDLAEPHAPEHGHADHLGHDGADDPEDADHHDGPAHPFDGIDL